ncbi:Uncharacterized protein FWK35_00035603, partial [Aphis craccivora]
TKPCEIDIYFVYNHLLNNAEALRHRYPTEELETIFSEYYSNNHSPSSDIEMYKIDLQNGSKCPTRKWCYDLYYKIFKQKYGAPTGEQMVDPRYLVYNLQQFPEEKYPSEDERYRQQEDQQRKIEFMSMVIIKEKHHYLLRTYQ